MQPEKRKEPRAGGSPHKSKANSKRPGRRKHSESYTLPQGAHSWFDDDLVVERQACRLQGFVRISRPLAVVVAGIAFQTRRRT
jgi:hypothetical protein